MACPAAANVDRPDAETAANAIGHPTADIDDAPAAAMPVEATDDPTNDAPQDPTEDSVASETPPDAAVALIE